MNGKPSHEFGYPCQTISREIKLDELYQAMDGEMTLQGKPMLEGEQEEDDFY